MSSADSKKMSLAGSSGGAVRMDIVSLIVFRGKL